ncbi:MAG: fluoride efflux transporter CrcB [Nitrospira sp.]|nr:fluoride efflux transporter CrcB [Nitrospira sp.]
MTSTLLVALGGAIGSVARYALSGWVLHHTVDWRFPLGTFAVNIIGCLIVGLLGGLVVKHDFFSANTRLFLFTGIAGGFTTFSAFGLETFYLLRRDEILVAGGYVVSSVVIGLLALWLGFGVVSARS